MMPRPQQYLSLVAAGFMTVLAIAGTQQAQAKTERSFAECRGLAVSRGVAIRATGRIYQREYMRRKAAGLPTKPKGLIARCMAGEPI